MKVCVIGAGLSGLTAADVLTSAGDDVTVFEGRDRVGGRVWSQRLPNGCIIERGAEYVDLEQHALLFTAARLGLSLAPAGTSFAIREPRGGIGTTKKEMLEAIEVAKDLLAREPSRLLHQSAAQVLADANISAGAREAIASRVQMTMAQEVERVSAYGLVHIGLSNAEGLRVAGGNQGIALRLGERLGKKIKLDHPVDRISWSHSNVSVRSKGETFDFETCIITVPASVMSQIDFDPALPEWKRTAIQSVVYAHAAKLHVPLQKVPPPSSVHSVPEFFWTWTAQDGNGKVQPVVSCFSGSPSALEKLDVKNGPEKWIQRLLALRPDLEMDVSGAVLSTWDDDPWVHGAYSVRSPNLPPFYDEYLIRAVGPLHFAGEYTGGLHSSSMDGALRTGMRAANEVLSLRYK
jgi:monoamine oxidase